MLSARMCWLVVAIAALIDATLVAAGLYAFTLIPAFIAWILMTLPAPAPTQRTWLHPDLLPSCTYKVAIAFRGSPPAVFEQLLEEGWKIGGCGPCEAGDHDGFVTLELTDDGFGREATRYRAAAAVEIAGAKLVRVGEAIPV